MGDSGRNALALGHELATVPARVRSEVSEAAADPDPGSDCIAVRVIGRELSLKELTHKSPLTVAKCDGTIVALQDGNPQAYRLFSIIRSLSAARLRTGATVVLHGQEGSHTAFLQLLGEAKAGG